MVEVGRGGTGDSKYESGITSSTRSLPQAKENTHIHTYAHWSRNTSPEGCAHPPIQPTQLLRKLLESFILVPPYGGIAPRG